MKNKNLIIRLLIIFFCISLSAKGQIKYIDIYVDQEGYENCITSIENTFKTEEIKIFPNPTNGEFQIVLSGFKTNRDLNMVIHNLKGSQVFSANLAIESNNEIIKNINLGHLESGAYILSISDKKHKYNCQLIIE